MTVNDHKEEPVGSLDDCESRDVCDVLDNCGLCCFDCEMAYECDDMCPIV